MDTIIGYQFKMKRDSSFWHFPWDIVLASGLPLIFPGMIFAVLGASPDAGMLVLVILSSCIAVAGGVIMSLAKIPWYRQGGFLTFGHAGLSPRNTRYYRTGFRLAAIGIIVGVVLVVVFFLP